MTEMTKIVEGSTVVKARNQRMKSILETVRMTGTVLEFRISYVRTKLRKGLSRDRLYNEHCASAALQIVQQ